MEIDYLSLLGSVGVVLTAVVPFFIILLRVNKKSLEKMHKTNVITSYLKTLGVTKVDSNFFNGLNQQGLTNVLSIIQYIKQQDSNPLAQYFQQLQQMGAVSQAAAAGGGQSQAQTQTPASQ